MANYIANISDVPFTGRLAKARDKAQARTIEARLLDGSSVLQTVGSANVVIEVEFYCTYAIRRVLEACMADAEPILVYGDGTVWTGVIRGPAIDWEPVSDVQQLLTFEVLALSEAARV